MSENTCRITESQNLHDNLSQNCMQKRRITESAGYKGTRRGRRREKYQESVQRNGDENGIGFCVVSQIGL